MIRDERGATLFTYRSFTTIVPIVAALMSVIVIIASVAASLFLFVEQRPLAAATALLLGAAFAIVINRLVPEVRVSLLDGTEPALAIAQQSKGSFPSTRFIVTTGDGTPIGAVSRSFFSRFARNRWSLFGADGTTPVGYAIEESWGRAFLRKFAGKFRSDFQADLHIRSGNRQLATIVRRPRANGDVDLLDLGANHDAQLDPRLALAVATLVFGMEP